MIVLLFLLISIPFSYAHCST